MFRIAFSVFSVALVSTLAFADVSCFRCGTTMHVDQTPACWHCGQPLGQPPVNPPPQPGPFPSNPNPGYPPTPNSPTPMSSGFELGIGFVPNSWGIRVTNVKPGSAADGVLGMGDTIVAAAYKDGQGIKRQLPTRSGGDMEVVKHMAGQSKTALKILRPTGQTRFAFVQFQKIAYTQTSGSGRPPVTHYKTETVMNIDNTGQAAALFGSGSGPAPSSPVPFNPGTPGPLNLSPATPADSAADFFN